MAFEADVDVPAPGGVFTGAVTGRGRTPGGRFNGDGIDKLIVKGFDDQAIFFGPNQPTDPKYLLWVDTDTNYLYYNVNGTWIEITSAAASAGLQWIDYVSNWSAPAPNQVGSTAQGDVYLYTYTNGTAYRLVPTDGVSTDGFYTTFNAGVLSGLIINRGQTI